MKSENIFTDADVEKLKHAFRAAIHEAAPEIIKKSMPLITTAITETLKQQLEQAIGQGVIGWVKRIVLGLILAGAGYTYFKSGGGFFK